MQEPTGLFPVISIQSMLVKFDVDEFPNMIVLFPAIRFTVVVTVEKTIAPKIAIKKDNINTIAVAKKEPLITNNQVDDNDINSFKQASDSPVIAVVAITPVIKKLKVVHINELGDPVEISPDVANKRDLHSFQLKLAGQEVYINPSTAFNKTGFTILKTKSSPN